MSLHIPICIGNQHIPALIDTGSQISFLSEELYHKLRHEGVEGLELVVQNAIIVSAFGNKTKRIRVKAMMPIRIDDIVVDHIFLISPQLLTQALLRVDFCQMNNIIINFPEQRFTMERVSNVSRHHFAYDNNIRYIGIGVLGPADNSTKTDIDSMQIAANALTNKATAVVCYLLGNSPASGVYMPTFRNTLPVPSSYAPYSHLPAYEDGTECSERSAYKLQTPGNYPKEIIQHTEHGESLKSRGATADYPRYNLRSGAVSEVDVVLRSLRTIIECPFGELASGDNDNCMIYEPELVTRCRLNEFCSSHATSDDRKSDSRGE